MQAPGRHGSPYRDMADRLLSNSIDEGGCWVWLGSCSADGYGRITVWLTGQARRRVMQAHRVSFETFIGPIPEGHDLDHRLGCPRQCIHPNHLTPTPYRIHRARTGWSLKNQPATN